MMIIINRATTNAHLIGIEEINMSHLHHNFSDTQKLFTACISHNRIIYTLIHITHIMVKRFHKSTGETKLQRTI